jgi:hypothetical protein
MYKYVCNLIKNIDLACAICFAKYIYFLGCFHKREMMILGAKFRSWDNFPWFLSKKDSLF